MADDPRPGLAREWAEILRREAAAYARVAMANIRREFPVSVHRVMTAPGDFPQRPRDLMPVFYGSYDWHSCVEMHWLLVRLLRIAPDVVPQDEIRTFLDDQFRPASLEAEAQYVDHPDNRYRQRPYGWAWALALVHEAATCEDADGRRWSAALAPLADAVAAAFLRWLPKATYPVRHGVHGNSAFGVSRALAHARDRAAAGDAALLDALTDASLRWFGGDAGYAAQFEPSGADFLSPALTEAELMAQLLDGAGFRRWLGEFLPALAGGEPAALFAPAVVTDPTDGYIAHLHGLNASRAWCWRRLAEELPDADPRVPVLVAAARHHAAAALPHVVGDTYQIEHWLAAYAVLMLS